MAADNNTLSQACSHCREVKPLEDFHRSKGRPNDRHPQCKICRSWLGREAALAKNDKRRERMELLAQNKQRCTSCDGVYALDEFYLNGKSSTGRKGQCAPCYSAVGEAYRSTPEARERGRARKAERIAADPEAHYESQRWASVKSKYGITRSDYEEMHDAQGGACAICRGDNGGGVRLFIDHDHGTGVVRGLLCHPCNAGLGMFRDSPESLSAAISYLA